jgi:hypothetical protein
MENLCESDTLEMLLITVVYLQEYNYLFNEIKHHVLTHLNNLVSNFKNRFRELTFQ